MVSSFSPLCFEIGEKSPEALRRGMRGLLSFVLLFARRARDGCQELQPLGKGRCYK